MRVKLYEYMTSVRGLVEGKFAYYNNAIKRPIEI